MNRSILSIFIVAILTVMAISSAEAATYYASPDGTDANAGTAVNQPFRTIQRAAAAAGAGDQCLIRAGVYRETVTLTRSGQQGKPITFAPYQGEHVILDGSDVVAGPWTKADGGIWKAAVPANAPIESVFCDGRMMIEARWPNCTWDQNWEPGKKWAMTDKGSAMGQVQSEALAKANIDLTGGRLYIKLSKGNSCYTRPITSHHAGSATFQYDKSGIEERSWGEDSMPERIHTYGFARNRFFVVARGALDAPEEWWHDAKSNELLFIPPGGDDPAHHLVSVKRRVTGFTGESVGDVVLDGLEFRACNARFAKAHRITLHNCQFLYPATPKVFQDESTARTTKQNVRIEGEENLIDHCLVEWAVDWGMEVEGTANRVENCVVHDCNLHGRHPGPAISVMGVPGGTSNAANVVRHCTVYNTGGVGIYVLGQGPATEEYNHLFNCGLYCVDVSGLYDPVGAKMQGTVADHNWIHDIHGIGFRVDVQGRQIVFHHNMVWNALSGCKMQGFQLDGYNNTVLVNSRQSAYLVVFEPEASPAERAGWRVRNNVAYAFLDRKSLKGDYTTKRPFIMPLKSVDGAIDHNVTVSPESESRSFIDPAHEDFRPRPGGPLDGKGVTIPGIAEGKGGRPPSIGALEVGEPFWIPGANWMEGKLPVPQTPHEATELARRLRPGSIPVTRGESLRE